MDVVKHKIPGFAQNGTHRPIVVHIPACRKQHRLNYAWRDSFWDYFPGQMAHVSKLSTKLTVFRQQSAAAGAHGGSEFGEERAGWRRAGFAPGGLKSRHGRPATQDVTLRNPDVGTGKQRGLVQLVGGAEVEALDEGT